MMMKKTDVLIATVLGLLFSVVAVWYAQPKWYKELEEEILEWRRPRRPSMNRYIERDRMRREEQEENEQRERGSSSERTPYGADVNAPQITFAVVDAATGKPVIAFRYRRYFEAKRPDDPPQENPWNTVSNNLGTFEIAGEPTYRPVERPRGETIAQTEFWKIVIEDEMRKRWAQSDTLEIEADGYAPAAIKLFELMNSGPGAQTERQLVSLTPLASHDDDAMTAEDSEIKTLEIKQPLNALGPVKLEAPPARPSAVGSLTGTVAGLREGEQGGIFAIKGDHTLSNVTEDDLYDFGDICDGEARVTKEGAFTIHDLGEGKYTVIAIAERLFPNEARSFHYTTAEIIVTAGTETKISLSLD